MMRALSLKEKFYLLIIIILVIFSVSGIFTIRSFRKVADLRQTNRNSLNLKTLVLLQRKNEKDFLAREVINPNYYETFQSRYLDSFLENNDSIYKLLSLLANDQVLHDEEFSQTIKQVKSYFSNYETAFQKLVNAINKRGFKDYGIVGDFRVSAHHAEDLIISHFGEGPIQVSLLMIRRHEKDFLLRDDLKYADELQEEVSKFLTLTENNRNSEEIAQSIKDYQKKFNALVTIQKEIGLNENEGLQGEMRDAVHQVDPSILKITREVDRKIDQTSKQAKLFLISVFIIGIGLILTICILIVRDMYHTLGGEPDLVASISKKIANGDLQDIVPTEKEKQRGAVRSMFLMAEKLKEIVSSIHHLSAQIAASTTLLSSTADQLSDDAGRQAGSLEEVSASMEEMVINIQKNNEHAKQTKNIASQSSEHIRSVENAMGTSLQNVRNIAEKIRVINDIARQTNIIALNAAVEAARAGKHGSEFAIVAAEVRKLAERSKKAADEIIKIASLSKNTTEDSGTKMQELIPQLMTTIELVQSISNSTTEQTIGATQVNSTLQELNSFTQQRVSVANQLAKNADELAKQSIFLEDLVGYFKV